MANAQISIQGVGVFDITTDAQRETYRNEITDIQSRKSTSPRSQRWSRGEIQPINLELMIVAGVTSSVRTGRDVVRTCEAAMGRAVQRAGAPSRLLNETTIKIGRWYERVCLVESCETEMMAPYDEESLPMAARITMTLRVVGAKHRPSRNNYSFKRQGG